MFYLSDDPEIQTFWEVMETLLASCVRFKDVNIEILLIIYDR